MSALLEELRAMGCDIDGAMARFLNNEDFYVRCLKKMLKDPSFAALGEALKQSDAENAFHQAHTLKGVVANMGITPLYDLTVEIVEPLRHGDCNPGLWSVYEKLLANKEEYQELIDRLGV